MRGQVAKRPTLKHIWNCWLAENLLTGYNLLERATMIVSFGDSATADLYHGRQTNRVRRFPPDVVRIALRKLDVLNSARQLDDLRAPPGRASTPR